MEKLEKSAADLLVAAFISMQPPAVVVSLARDVGGGRVSQLAQQFFLDRCFNNEVHVRYPSSQSYVRRVVKQIILAAESDGQEVKQDLYDLHGVFLDSDNRMSVSERCYKTYSFMIPESARQSLMMLLGKDMASEFMGTKLLTVRISMNVLDGDTGYCVWPAGLYLSEVLLSHPELVYGKSCLELGAGTGICGIWISMLSPSKVVLTDGSLSTLANMKHNLGINGIPQTAGGTSDPSNKSGKGGSARVECRQLLWGTASEQELREYKSDVIFGADLIYDPTIVPYLVQVLGVLLQDKTASNGGRTKDPEDNVLRSNDGERRPVAYIAAALRNVTTIHLFIKIANELGLSVTDVTESLAPLKILAESYIFDRSELRLYKVAFPEYN